MHKVLRSPDRAPLFCNSRMADTLSIRRKHTETRTDVTALIIMRQMRQMRIIIILIGEYPGPRDSHYQRTHPFQTMILGRNGRWTRGIRNWQLPMEPIGHLKLLRRPAVRGLDGISVGTLRPQAGPHQSVAHVGGGRLPHSLPQQNID
jgi:hypothetical protein